MKSVSESAATTADHSEPAPEGEVNAASPFGGRLRPVCATFADMRLRVGDQLPFETRMPIAGGQASVQILGWLEGNSLMVTAPRNTAGRVPLDIGNSVTLRAFTGKSAYAFRTVVTRLAYQPFPYVHLRFPEKVESVVIRGSFRHRLKLPASVQQAGSTRDGTIVDIGTSGAQVELASPLESSAESLRISTSLTLHGVPVTLDVQASIRSATVQAGDDGESRHRYGVEFRELTPNDRLVLGSLLWYEMHEHPREVA